MALPAPEPAPQSTAVAVREGVLSVERWTTRDPAIVRFFAARLEAGHEPAEVVLERTVRAGVLALEAAGVAAHVDHVAAEFARLVDQVDRLVVERLGELRGLLDPARTDSVPGQLRQLLHEHVGGHGSHLYRLLDPGHEHSPLRRLGRELAERVEALQRSLQDMRTELAERLAALQARSSEREHGALKGRDYQELVFEAVSRLARVHGDVAEAVWDVAGRLGPGNKRGDVVVQVDPAATAGIPVRVVFEAKDAAVGRAHIVRELAGARENRDAAVGVAVYSRPEHMPRGACPLECYDTRTYLCLLDKEDGDTLPLELAYRLARFWARVHAMQARGAEVDLRGVQEELQRARELLGQFARVKAALTQLATQVQGSVQHVQEQLDALRRELAAVFGALEARLSARAPDGSAPGTSDSPVRGAVG